jgi:hypothetical protein
MTCDPTMETAIVIFTICELILMPFLEHYITLPLIKINIKFLMLLVKSNIFWDNTEYTKHARNKSLFK